MTRRVYGNCIKCYEIANTLIAKPKRLIPLAGKPAIRQNPKSVLSIPHPYNKISCEVDDIKTQKIWHICPKLKY
jgi:hypothetical protein